MLFALWGEVAGPETQGFGSANRDIGVVLLALFRDIWSRPGGPPPPLPSPWYPPPYPLGSASKLSPKMNANA